MLHNGWNRIAGVVTFIKYCHLYAYESSLEVVDRIWVTRNLVFIGADEFDLMIGERFENGAQYHSIATIFTTANKSTVPISWT